jgi:lambda repressor-like predicted transcriptional regulator
MTLTEVQKKGRSLRASDSRGDFSEEFIADVLEAKREAELGLGKRFDKVDDLIADLLED